MGVNRVNESMTSLASESEEMSTGKITTQWVRLRIPIHPARNELFISIKVLYITPQVQNSDQTAT